MTRGGAVWKLVGLITRRSQVQILPPQFACSSHGHALYALVAQLVEQRTENPRVTGSIPVQGISFYQLPGQRTCDAYAVRVWQMGNMGRACSSGGRALDF